MHSENKRENRTPMDTNGQEWLEATTAFSLAARLTVIPGFPRREEAIEAVADWLIDRCTPRRHEGQVWAAKDQASWLVSTAIEEWAEWGGVAALRTLWLGKFHPGVLEYKSLGPPPPPDCPRCQDNGIIPHIGDGGADWCDCAAAEQLRARIPNLCEDRNRRAAARAARTNPSVSRPAPPTPALEPITQQDIDRALAAHRAAKTATRHSPGSQGPGEPERSEEKEKL